MLMYANGLLCLLCARIAGEEEEHCFDAAAAFADMEPKAQAEDGKTKKEPAGLVHSVKSR